MVWSQFSIKIFGVHFGNSVLDNSNWDKISHSLTKKLHMWGRWGIPQNFLLAFIDGFWKTRKMRLLKKWKKLLEKTSFYTSVPKIIIICYTIPEIWCVMGVIVIFHFGLFFAFLPLPHLTARKMIISKQWKKQLEISFYTSGPKIMIICYTVPEI